MKFSAKLNTYSKINFSGFGGQDSISHIVTVFRGITPNYPVISPSAAMDTLKVCDGDTLVFEGDAGALSYL